MRRLVGDYGAFWVCTVAMPINSVFAVRNAWGKPWGWVVFTLLGITAAAYAGVCYYATATFLLRRAELRAAERADEWLAEMTERGAGRHREREE